jgi:hypothetical protein
MATINGHSVYDNVVDQFGRPVASALVTIRDEDGALVSLGEANPMVTDSTGYWETTLDPGTYTLVISKGDDSITRTLVVCEAIRTPFLAEIGEQQAITVLNSTVLQTHVFDSIVVGSVITITVV